MLMAAAGIAELSDLPIELPSLGTLLVWGSFALTTYLLLVQLFGMAFGLRRVQLRQWLLLQLYLSVWLALLLSMTL
jgi:hypothetical protein